MSGGSSSEARFPDLPPRMRALHVDHRGFPVPWFVAWVNDKPLFPMMDEEKLIRAVRENRCWVCGDKLPPAKAFVIGPMCVVNRVSAEPPSHIDCARFSARNCPFLANPNMKRVPTSKLPDFKEAGGIMIKRNPGATALYICRDYQPFRAGEGVLFKVGRASKVEWYAHGRDASRDEVLASIETGLPLLEAQCDMDDDPADARAELARMTQAAMSLLPTAEGLTS